MPGLSALLLASLHTGGILTEKNYPIYVCAFSHIIAMLLFYVVGGSNVVWSVEAERSKGGAAGLLQCCYFLSPRSSPARSEKKHS